jgi:predicted PurR-regulated permease PerM
VADADRTEKARTISLVLIAVVAVALAFYLGREFFQPIAIAVLLSALFRPIVRMMEKWRVPTWIGSSIVVLTLIAALGVGAYLLAGPVKSWMESAPQSLEAAEQKLARLRRPMQQVSEVATKIEQATQGASSQPAADPAPAPQQSPVLVRLFGSATALLGGLAEVLLMLYLLLGMGDLFYQKLLKVMPGPRDKTKARQVVTDVENAVGRYMFVTLLMNIAQGAAAAIVMKTLGMPQWIMWGLLSLVLEFIPYLGAVVMIALLSISAFTQFDSLGHILAAPLAYLVITNIQNVLAPLAYGSGMRLNPVAVLIGVLLWWFLWGIPGAFVAVPILATIKIVADRTDGLHGLGEFLGE